MATAALTDRVPPAATGGTTGCGAVKGLVQPRALLLCLSLLLLLISAYDPARAATKVEISLNGDLTESQRQNIRSHLSLARLAEDEPLSPALFHRLYGKIAKETALALEPFGYYSPDIEVSQHQQNNQWQVNLVVATGLPVLISRVEIGLSGPGKEDPTLQKAVQQFPLQATDVLDHQRYEEAKAQLITTALESGYLSASYRNNRVEIRRQQQSASMELHLDTGPRYTFGPLTFSTDAIDHQLLQRIVPVREGDPFSPKALARLRQSLFTTEYFTAVDLDYTIDQAASTKIPVRVLLTPSLAHKYGIGLGYGTDTGPRGTLEYTNRYINPYGHQLDLQLQPSQRKSNLGGVYTIPIGDPKRERLSLLGKYQVEQFDSTESKSWTAIVSRDHFREQGEYATYLQILDEQFSTGADNGHAALLIPGIKGSLFWADSRLVTTRGLRISASLSGSEQDLLADTSFLQSTIRLKGIYTLFEKWRLIGRADLGSTLTDDIDALPPSLRFFAGGDQSVRGYGYKKIGPADADGNIIGGKHLLTSSLELERTLFDQWSGVFFYDSGTATNSFADLHLQAGAGVGVRWNAPFGQIRLDLAKALEDDGNSWRIHFTMGADL